MSGDSECRRVTRRQVCRQAVWAVCRTDGMVEPGWSTAVEKTVRRRDEAKQDGNQLRQRGAVLGRYWSRETEMKPDGMVTNRSNTEQCWADVGAERDKGGKCHQTRGGVMLHFNIMLGGMTKNVYHGILQNSYSFTVYDSIFFSMHNQVFTAFSTG